MAKQPEIIEEQVETEEQLFDRINGITDDPDDVPNGVDVADVADVVTEEAPVKRMSQLEDRPILIVHNSKPDLGFYVWLCISFIL